MNTILQALDAAGKMPLSERLSTAGTTTLMGMVTVFAVLAIIMFIVMLMGKIFGVKNKKKGEDESDKVTQQPAASPEPPADSAGEGEEAQVIAVLTAAIAAYRGSGAPAGTTPEGFRVVSFRKKKK